MMKGFIFAAMITCVCVVAATTAVPNLIIDTDMSTDCDDVGAVCIANAMMDNGEVKLVAVVHNTGLPEGIGAVSVINTYYGRPNIPLGAYKGPFDATLPGPYVEDLVANFSSDVKNFTQVPDAVSVYRKVLADCEDDSVVVASIGFTTNMEALLKSPADQYSPLSGHDLVARKVKELAWMGGKYPAGYEWNFSHGTIGPSTAYVVDNWPSKMTFSGYEIGQAILTGGSMSTKTSADNPCRKAYIDYNGYGKDRYSWDPATTLYAVRGLEEFYTVHNTGHNLVNMSGFNMWVDDKVSTDMGYLVFNSNESAQGVADALTVLMDQPPKHLRK